MFGIEVDVLHAAVSTAVHMNSQSHAITAQARRLLTPVSNEQAKSYLDQVRTSEQYRAGYAPLLLFVFKLLHLQVVKHLGCAVKVQHDAQGKGKGVFACQVWLQTALFTYRSH